MQNRPKLCGFSPFGIKKTASGEKSESGCILCFAKTPFYDYPQFALPLYNLCSNVGLYETAAITNRSNILSPKYLRLNL